MPTKAQYDTGFGITSTVFVAEGVFKTGDKVYLRSSVVGIGAAGKDFKKNENELEVVGPEYITNVGGDFLDANLVVAAGVTAASIDTDGGAAPNTDPAWPHYYRCLPSSGKTTLIHESLLISVTGVNTLIDAEVWT